jgi:riboflavin synthase
MFTGIVEEVGSVLRLAPKSAGARLTITCRSVLEDAVPGASIAVNGACVTAIDLGPGEFSADLSPETLKRTNLGDLASGSAVNLERPLRFNGRLDGHFVLGHVDGTAEIVSLDPLGDDNWWLRLRVPSDLARFIVSKASVAVDGISLTVAEIERDVVGFTIIPQTYSHTALPSRVPGARLNLEVDILAKHLEKLLATGATGATGRLLHSN